jgi:mono/diheme cytochrome c family protein
MPIRVSLFVLLALVAGRSPLGAQAPAAAQTEASAGGDLARGQYIVEQVAQCGRCHTPVDKNGERDQFRKLLGGPLDFEPTVVKHYWALAAPRLAGNPPGTDEEFVRLMMTGISRTGTRPLRPMPQFGMTQADAEAVLAYIKSLPAR